MLKEDEELEKLMKTIFEDCMSLTMDTSIELPDNYLIRKSILKIKLLENKYNVDLLNKSMFAVVIVLTDNFGHGSDEYFEDIPINKSNKVNKIIDKTLYNINIYLQNK